MGSCVALFLESLMNPLVTFEDNHERVEEILVPSGCQRSCLVHYRMKSVVLLFPLLAVSSIAFADLGIFQSILELSNSTLATRVLFITQYRNFENAARSRMKAAHKSQNWKRWLLQKQSQADWISRKRGVKKVNKLEVNFCDGA